MSIKRTLLVVLATSLALVGCSSDKDNFRTNSFPAEVTAGQQDISNALIRSAEILVTGLPDENNEGMLNSQSFYTQASGTATVVLPLNPGSKMRLFELVTLPANADINQAASKSRCQWVEGCGSKEFGADISPVYQWQSVVWDLRKDERVVVTPLTHLAAALAFEYAYAETPEPEPVQPGETPVSIDPLWQETGYYSPYSVEQAISQVSKLFGISNIQTTFPADLTRINSLNVGNELEAKNSVRYGALLAAWARLQEENPEFTQKATAEFIANQAQFLEKGQLLENGQPAFLTLETLYQAAIDNLTKLTVHNAGVKQVVASVVSGLQADIETFTKGNMTSEAPASIKDLFGSEAYSNYQLGVERTKLFIDELKDQSKYFFGDTYDGLINTYLEEQKEFFKSNKDNFNAVLKSLKSAESIYIDSYYGSACSNSSSWDANLWSDCNYSGNVLTLTDKSVKQVTLSMKNVTSNKQAVDIEMTGELKIDDLLFKLNDSATNKSRVRLFYSEETSQVLDSTIEPIGYEYNWASFSFNDTVKKDQEWTGNFSLLYRGVSDPTGISFEQHFNIDTLRLSSRISDHIGGTDKDDKEASSVFIAAKSSTADTYYNPDEKFGKINGFFTEQSVNDGQDIPGLVSYKLGEELIRNQTDKYFDFYIQDESAQSFRYRFYPDVVRNQNAAGQYTVGNNDAITTHKMAVCPLSKKKYGEWGVDGACSPAQVFNGKRDVQKSINTFWKAGAFSYIDLPGKGEYFVKWPAKEKNGCYELDKLSETAQPVPITESAKFVSAAVLGLDTLRVTTEVMLENQPRTLLDVLISAPKEDRYNVTAALSHNYSNLTEDKIFVGTGNNLDRLIFNYNTDSS